MRFGFPGAGGTLRERAIGHGDHEGFLRVGVRLVEAEAPSAVL
jgi:hypothetical protein